MRFRKNITKKTLERQSARWLLSSISVAVSCFQLEATEETIEVQ